MRCCFMIRKFEVQQNSHIKVSYMQRHKLAEFQDQGLMTNRTDYLIS